MSDNNSESEDIVPKTMSLNSNKAGMTGLDIDGINQTIFEWTKGSNFHSFQTKRQKRIDDQIIEMKKKLLSMTEWQRNQCLKDADTSAKAVESTRVLNRIIVYVDLDMFFAAVEIKHNPDLADKPIAIGSDQMLSTSNYVARKYGIRPAMPGALARRLCPQLIIINNGFHHYIEESKEVMKIISDFDPKFVSMGLDECYMDLTDYTIDRFCALNPDFEINSIKQTPELPQCLWDSASEVVETIRQRICNETQLTASAGIACNSMIAKVCSDVNKPNGQYMVAGNMRAIDEFLETTPVKKISGIGPVRAQYLTALDINTCKDLWHKRDIIRFAFTPFNADYYLRVSLGIGSHIVNREDEPRKSISSERTVKEISDFDAIRELLQELSHELCNDLIKRNQICKTVTIKLKKITFQTTLKSQTLPYYTCDSETIMNVTKSLLENEFTNTSIDCRKYRLIGLKVSNLKSTQTERKVGSQLTLSQIFNALKTDSNQLDSNTSHSMNVEGISAEGMSGFAMSAESESMYSKDDNQSEEEFVNHSYDSNLFECSVCLQTFKHKNVFEIHENDCFGQLIGDCVSDESEVNSGPNDDNSETTATTSALMNNSSHFGESSETSSYLCPICCNQVVVKDNDELNRHIDVCLNRGMCQQLTQVPTPANTTPESKSEKRVNSESKVNSNQKSKKQKKSLLKSEKRQKTIEDFFSSQ